MEINEKVNDTCECDVTLEVSDTTTIIRDPVWGEIKGNIYTQKDLQDEFALYRKSAEQDTIDENLQSQVTENLSKLDSEIERSVSKDNELDDAITGEFERAAKVENQLTENLNKEITRAKSAESDLGDDIKTLQTDNVINKANIKQNADDIDTLESKNFVQLVKILNSSNITVTGGEKGEDGIQQFSLEVTGQTPSELTSNLTFFNDNPQQMIASNVLLELDEKTNSIILYNNCYVNGEMVEKTSTISLSTDHFKIVNGILTLAKDYLETSTASATYLSKSDAILTYATKDELSTETTNRTQGDTKLQEQIDAINSRSDVVDVVASKADLDAYDKDITINDVVKVLQDETHNNATSYYRNTAKSKPYIWEFIGSLDQYYTKAEIDEKINDEEAARVATDNTLQSQITEEIEARSTKDTELENSIKSTNTNLSTEVTRATTKENKIADDLASEVTRATTKENEIIESLEAEVTRATTKETEISDALAAEITRASNAESELEQSKVNKTSEANKIYGTDANGSQITYNSLEMGAIDDVTYNGKSLVKDRVVSLNGFLTYDDSELS